MARVPEISHLASDWQQVPIRITSTLFHWVIAFCQVAFQFDQWPWSCPATEVGNLPLLSSWTFPRVFIYYSHAPFVFVPAFLSWLCLFLWLDARITYDWSRSMSQRLVGQGKPSTEQSPVRDLGWCCTGRRSMLSWIQLVITAPRTVTKVGTYCCTLELRTGIQSPSQRSYAPQEQK